MNKTKLLFLTLILSCVLTSNAVAKPNLPPPVEDFVKLEKMAGDPGPFITKEDFPKSYFLIPQNLPFLIGLALYHPSSSNLNLTKEQIDELQKYKQYATPQLAKKALAIKKLELEVVSDIALKHNNVKAETFYEKVDKIAKLRAELTKAHLRCIEKVKSILTSEQYEELLDYGVVNMF